MKKHVSPCAGCTGERFQDYSSPYSGHRCGCHLDWCVWGAVNYVSNSSDMVSFGMSGNFQQIHINTVCSNLGDFKARALPGFHAFSGCDTTSQFYDKAKKLAWEAWKSYPEVTAAFNYMKEQPFKAIEQDSPTFKLRERFTCVLYDKTSDLESVNEQRQDLFSRKSMALINIPPTQVSNKMISGM